jgi:hypothetical protein
LFNGILDAARTARAVLLTALFAALLLLLLGPVVQAAEKNSASVSFLDGKASVTAGSKVGPLALNSVVHEGDVVETQPAARLELKMKDGSVIRVGPASKLELKSAYFGEKGEKTFSARLLFGRVWSKVTGLVGSESKFEIETDNAVAGVRGTTFRVDAASDRSVLVRVYAGSVAMAPGAVLAAPARPGSGGRVQVAGPRAITKKEWEVLVGKMMQLSVNADGTPSAAEPFTLEDEAKDEWASWNRAMDEK